MDAKSPSLAKRRIRSEVRERRRDVFAGEKGAALRSEHAQSIRENAGPLFEKIDELVAGAAEEFAPAPLVAVFRPEHDEADVMPLVREMIAHGARVIFPVAGDGKELDWALWDGDSDFIDSPARGFGAEPTGDRLGAEALEDVELVLAPAVAVDRSATRIGHGGGYYDRALRHLAPESPVVVIVHPWEVLEAGSLPRMDHDLPVDAVLTADGLEVLSDRPLWSPR